jgi:hypothetical protein
LAKCFREARGARHVTAGLSFWSVVERKSGDGKTRKGRIKSEVI